MKLLVCLVCVCSILATCSSTKKNIEGKEKRSVESVQITNYEIKLVEIRKGVDFDIAAVDYTITSASLKDSILTMEIAYKGGCGDHDFNLWFSGAWAKSLPMRATLFLEHKAEKETCSKNIKSQLLFNLKPMLQPVNEQIIRIHGYDKELPYNL